VGRIRHCLDDPGECEIVVCDLKLRSIEAADVGAEAPKMIEWQAHDLERGQVAIGDVLVEFSFPFLEMVTVRHAHVETTIINIVVIAQSRSQGGSLRDAILERAS